jgi:drug/metabolite transporter (DMT)-like permease
MAGIYLLCLSGGWSGIYLGDILVLLCAFTFTFHILAVDRFADPVGGVRLSMLQFIVCGVLSLVLSLIFEWDNVFLSNVIAATPSILYMGIVSSGIAYTLQVIGQKNLNPGVASILLSLESVFGAIGGALIFGERMSPREIIGSSVVFFAVILSQIELKNIKKSK